MNIKCASCGKFIPEKQLVKGGGCVTEFTPDSHFGPEIIEHICKECVKKEGKRK